MTRSSHCWSIKKWEEHEDGDLGSISPTFYKHLLRSKISSMQKKTDGLTVFCCAFGIFVHKSCLQNIDEIDTRSQFHQRFLCAFFVQKPFFLVTIWLWTNFCTKYVRVKCWWNWAQVVKTGLTQLSQNEIRVLNVENVPSKNSTFYLKQQEHGFCVSEWLKRLEKACPSNP